ncbi:MerR family transcriptional regulator, partial [Microbacterium sp.]|uniref:MerR family transcriptional regulator n=1 Tax=Microbacterium sp. TaxID=51671 RepID=UPI003F9A3C90
MKLSELAVQSGVSTTTLKHWIRVGILPAGRLRNRTTAVYEQRHVDRARLIAVMRDSYHASTAAIRSLTELIDTDGVATLDVMNACQAFALGT